MPFLDISSFNQLYSLLWESDILLLFLLGCDAPIGAPPIIPDIKDDYLEVKMEFVRVCTTQGSPTLEQVRDVCIDLIECAFKNIPRTSRHEDDICTAKEIKELARVVCFHLSNWVSYDFFKKVISKFQPTLKIVEDRLISYEGKLKPLLLQKLERIAELQQQ